MSDETTKKLEAKRAEIAARAESKAEEIKARDEREELEILETFADEIVGGSVVVMPPLPSDDQPEPETMGNVGLPGRCVFRLPIKAEIERVNRTFAQPADKPGIPDERAKALANLASSCLKWPAREQYKALVESFAGLPGRAGAALMKSAEARAKEVGKG